ncbi:AzlC family ABC transporter permease, partial [Pseudonocardia abyssalis]|uniref:AzlC family ABC transporter permease n=1 Tax=Pseudonocardia abyssalis TaxID=2792008 RepID=UPI0027E34C53
MLGVLLPHRLQPAQVDHAAHPRVVAAGGSPVAAVVAGLLINARHLPFGLAMAPVVGRSWPRRLLGAHILIDESVAFARGREERGRAYWTSGIALFVFWNVGTVVGLVGGSAVPDTDGFGIDAAFPAALLALLFPGLRAADARRVGLTAAALALVATPFLSPGLPVLVGLLGLVVAGRAPAAGTPAAGTRGAGPSTAGPSSAGPSSAGPSSAGPPAAGTPGADRPADRPDRGGVVNWAAVLALAAGTYLMRLSGLALRDRMTLTPRVERL